MTRKLEMIRVAVIFLIKSQNVNIELLKTIERKEISTFYLFAKAHSLAIRIPILHIRIGFLNNGLCQPTKPT